MSIKPSNKRPSLTAIYARCVTRGGCKLWQGAMSRGYPYIYDPELYARTGGKGMVMGRGFVWLIKHGKPHTGTVAMTCGDKMCLAHEHMVDTDKSGAQKIASSFGAYDTVRHKVARRVNAQKLAKLTPEIVKGIRQRVAGGEKQAAVAASLGVTISTISSVVRRVTWKEDRMARNCSVFHMGEAA